MKNFLLRIFLHKFSRVLSCHHWQGFAITLLAIGTVLVIDATKSFASPGDDEKIVAALDTQYQAAVKANDAAAMDRILADDFVLVTGRGKTQGKADLLKEAGGKVIS